MPMMGMLMDAAAGMSSGGVIWGLIAASFGLEIIVFALCVAVVSKRRK